MYEMDKIVDLWEKQFPNVVLSSNSFCPIITHPNIAKSMAMEERIWEIPCKGIELSDVQEDDSNENKIHDSMSEARELSSPRTFIHQRFRDLTFGTAEWCVAGISYTDNMNYFHILLLLITTGQSDNHNIAEEKILVIIIIKFSVCLNVQ